MLHFLRDKEDKTMKKETSGHKHEASELSTHPKVPSPKARHPHPAHISSAVLLQLLTLSQASGQSQLFSSLWPGTAVKLGVLLCALNSEQGEMARPPQCKGVQWTLSTAQQAAPQDSAAEQWGKLTFCSVRALLLLLPQNRKGCEVLIKVSFQNSSSSQRGWLIEGLGRCGRGVSWNGAHLGWETRKSRQGEGQALELFKCFLSQPPLLFSSPIRCPGLPVSRDIALVTTLHSSPATTHPCPEKLCQNQR